MSSNSTINFWIITMYKQYLSPILYTHYIHDVSTCSQVKLSLYTNDVMFYAANKNINYAIIRLQKQVNITIIWLEKWCLKFKIQKSVSVLFNKNSKSNNRKINIAGKIIEWAPNAKYFGVIFDHKLRLNRNTEALVQKEKRSKAALYPILNRNSAVLMANGITIYKIYIRPILMYTAAVWRSFINERNWTKIEAV